MNPSTNPKQLIARYLSTLSGQPKTPELGAQFVSDPHLLEHIRDVEAAFPRYEIVAEQIIAEGDLVAMRGVFRGVQRGTFAGIEPTGKSVSAGPLMVYRLAGGRIAEHWMQFDLSAVLDQLRQVSATTASLSSYRPNNWSASRMDRSKSSIR